MAETYGFRPTTLLGSEKSRMAAFRLDWNVYAATQAYKEERREAERSAAAGPGSASPRERQQLVDAKDARAEARQEMEDADASAGSLSEQQAALQEARTNRDEAREDVPDDLL